MVIIGSGDVDNLRYIIANGYRVTGVAVYPNGVVVFPLRCERIVDIQFRIALYVFDGCSQRDGVAFFPAGRQRSKQDNDYYTNAFHGGVDY